MCVAGTKEDFITALQRVTTVTAIGVVLVLEILVEPLTAVEHTLPV
jgi:hypothetical protein